MAPVDEVFSQLQGFVAKGAAELSQGVERGWHGAVARFDAARRNPLPLPLPLASIAGADRSGSGSDGQRGGFRLPDPIKALQAAMSGGRPQETPLEPSAGSRRRRVVAAESPSDGLVLVSNKAYGDGSATDARRNQLPTIRTSLSQAMEATYAGRQGARGMEGDVDRERGRGRREGGAVLAGSAVKGRDGRKYEEWAGPAPDFLKKAAQEAGPATKEELGRATWTFLHTLAAQFPEKPSKQQQKDAKEFVTLLARVYPCKICSYHFQKIVKANPPQAGSRGELEQYMCRLHNIVNRSLKKPEFPCKRVSSRWGSLECEDNACEV
ncbi:hypothetical protein CLOM_g8622 [Closterium sp. NIES-68]|nr:hypothetical protein CLOM_g8622 [Closterium sp. NIES-68]GJP67109.1 hypothetical protein CLOP_g23972 [Closterium sp. NIES-67]